MKITLGGDRLGSGNKNKIALHNYERSTHNLSQKFTSSLQCGTLYPFLCIPAMRGDKFTINLNADARTIPTKGPLFGSFKMQVDLFQCDVRLYQAILHNNPLAIGLKMGQVKFPQLEIMDGNVNGTPFANSSLMKYLGLSGLGHKTSGSAGDTTFLRYVNAIPALAYYEIFKTYYSNKQEENAYIIGTETKQINFSSWEMGMNSADLDNYVPSWADWDDENDWYPTEIGNILYLKTGENTDIKELQKNTNVWYGNYDSTSQSVASIGAVDFTDERYFKYLGMNQNGEHMFQIIDVPLLASALEKNRFYIVGKTNLSSYYNYSIRGLQPFALANIDDMRLKLLSHHTLGIPFKITSSDSRSENSEWNKTDGTGQDGLPYTNLVDFNANNVTRNSDPLNGLVVKTYQSDLFNNWVNTEWIDGENGIANVTAISTASGSIKIDSLNLSEKLYNMLNRVAVSDGSYEGWQDAVYTETPKRHIESPVYLGGMSSEIMFEEIVQTAPADGNPLGTLGGKGKLIKRKGGHVVVKCNEACFIIGIVSLTPRVNYTQGNEWYLTDLMSMDDFHKPALDGIGFQNLIAERAAWWDTGLSQTGTITGRHSIGKVPAWIEYMTAVDKAYGDFAETEGRGFMSLNREYGRSESTHAIEDATTYIDPRKYNYAFAYTDIDAQNFWVQIYSEISARRLMSAKQIPNI